MSDNNTKYTSPFKRVQISQEGAQLVKKLQRDFDRFWHAIKPEVGACHERAVGLQKLQEACMWLTRAVAVSHRSEGSQSQLEIKDNNQKLENPVLGRHAEKAIRCKEMTKEKKEQHYCNQTFADALKKALESDTKPEIKYNLSSAIVFNQKKKA